jgi:RNA polymerase sigma factor (sigma-70 family)
MSLDQRLIARLAESRDDAWDEFVHRYEPRILGFATSWGLQDADAQDVTQNVLLSVARVIDNFEFNEDRGTLWNWIATITHREILHHLGRLERLRKIMANSLVTNQTTVSAASARSPAALSSLYETALIRTQTLCRPTDWRVFHAVWIDDASPESVAEQEGHPVAWVYRAKFRALEHLRHEVDLLTEDSAFAEV